VKGADWVVVGGGVIGLAAAWQLAAAGAEVRVLEARQVGDGATPRAAGMLLPTVEGEAGEERRRLKASFDLYPAFLKALRHDADVDVAYRPVGCWLVAKAEAFATAWPGRAPAPPEEVRSLPLAPGLAAAHVPEAAHLDPGRLLTALRLAAAARGVSIEEGTPVYGVERTGDRWRAVLTPRGPVVGDRFLVATGAWTGALLPELAVHPVKGEMVELHAPAVHLPAILFGHGVYLCPKDGGRVYVGATMVEAGFDPAVRAGAVAGLIAAAAELVPALAEAEIRRVWSGFRPGRSGGPFVGPVGENAFAAVGHFRNGILLAPWTTAEILRQSGAVEEAFA
jgi:glycine oxidase ThiO